MKTMVCKCDRRREAVRAKSILNGLDYLEVSNDQRTLFVYFLGKAPQQLGRHNFRIDGGQRVRDIEVIEVEIDRNPDPRLDDAAKLRLDRAGDFSTYTLRLIDVAEPIDPCYDRLDFSFKINCPGELDCRGGAVCSPKQHPAPEINYLAKDYASFRQLILDRLALVLPDWKERHVPDIGIALVEALAYTGDYLSYFQDGIATEAYLETARRRISVRRHARLVDYRMHEGVNARAWVCFEVSGSVTLDPSRFFLVAGLDDATQMPKRVLSSDELRDLYPVSYIAYEPIVADRSVRFRFHEEHNKILFHSWGQRRCCLMKGSISATLRDGWSEGEAEPPAEQGSPLVAAQGVNNPPVGQRARMLDLRPGHVLIFEEILGPKSGHPADADPAHRHAVRLTKAEPGIDPLDGTPILEIEWSPEDALPFPLCLSALSDAEHGCVYNPDVSIARGNVLLVDHGLTIDDPKNLVPNQVPVMLAEAECYCEGRSGDVSLIPGRFRPRLDSSPVTFGQPADFGASASRIVQQNPREALPQVWLSSRVKIGSKVLETAWESRFDLLESSGIDPHFVVEIDDHAIAHLRFGDGDCGWRPEAGMTFSARCRIGNGKAGNVGAEAISHLVYRNEKPAGIETIRNPMPASGGSDPESIREVKLFAPWVFRKQLQRAITADDYARIAEWNPKAQKSGALLSWNGSWHEVQVAIDRKGAEQVEASLRREIENLLEPYRRIGHGIKVVSGDYVSLDIAMDICVRHDVLRGHVNAALLDVFSNRMMSNGKLGFFHADRLTFGDGIYLSGLIAAAMSVEGVENARVTRLQRQFERPDHELENGLLPLGPLEIGRCDNDPNNPEHGKFVLNLKGGR